MKLLTDRQTDRQTDAECHAASLAEENVSSKCTKIVCSWGYSRSTLTPLREFTTLPDPGAAFGKGSLCAATEEGGVPGVGTPVTAVILLRACVDFIWAQDPHASSKVYVSWQ